MAVVFVWVVDAICLTCCSVVDLNSVLQFVS